MATGDRDEKGGLGRFEIGFGVKGQSTVVAGGDQHPPTPDPTSSTAAREPPGPSARDARATPEEGGALELSPRGPLHIVVLSALCPSAQHSMGPDPVLRPLPVDASTIDDVMRALSPSFTIDVDDPFRGPPLRIDLRWTELRSLRLPELADALPVTRGLLDARAIVKRVETGELGQESAATQLRRCLARPEWAEAVLSRLSSPGRRGADGTGDGPSGAAPAPRPDRLASLFDKVDVPGEDRGQPRRSGDRGPQPPSDPSMGSLIGAFARGGSGAAAARPESRAALDELARAFSAVLRSILAHPEFRRLEAAWRGLRLLLEHATPSGGSLVEVIPAGPDQIEQALESLVALQRRSDDSPIDLLVADAFLTPAAADLDRAERWGELAAELPAPLVVGGTPELLGIDDLHALGRTQRRLAGTDDARAVALRALSARDASRWLAVALNGPVLRGPYTPETSKLREPAFDEAPDGGGAPLFGSPSLLVAAVVARSFARTGHAFSLLGPHNGKVPGLPVHELPPERGGVAVPVQALASIEAQEQAARAGIILVGSPANRDTAILLATPMLFRGEAVARGGDPAPVHSLADQLFVARCANAVHQLARAIPAGTNRTAAAEVARIALAELFPAAGVTAPQFSAKVREDGQLEVSVRPGHYADVRLGEVSFAARIG